MGRAGLVQLPGCPHHTLLEWIVSDAHAEGSILCQNMCSPVPPIRNHLGRSKFPIADASARWSIRGTTPDGGPNFTTPRAARAAIPGKTGYLNADAHNVYDHLFKPGTIIELGCCFISCSGRFSCWRWD